MSLGEWYVNQDKRYENWRKNDRKEMVKVQLLYYGLPAVIMIALAIIGGTSK